MHLRPLAHAVATTAILALGAIGIAHAQQPADIPPGAMAIILSTPGDVPGPPLPETGEPRDARVMSKGQVTVFADGVVCVTSPVLGNGQVVVLGLPSQPDACGREGARVTFENGAGQLLIERFVFEAGRQVRVERWGFGPLDSGPLVAATGGGGLERDRETNMTLVGLIVGLAFVSLIGVRVATKRSKL